MLHQPLDVSQAGAPAILGCDVAKATIQIHDNASGRNWSIPNKPQPLAALIVTHNHELAGRMDRRVTLAEGKVVPL